MMSNGPISASGLQTTVFQHANLGNARKVSDIEKRATTPSNPYDHIHDTGRNTSDRKMKASIIRDTAKSAIAPYKPEVSSNTPESPSSVTAINVTKTPHPSGPRDGTRGRRMHYLPPPRSTPKAP